MKCKYCGVESDSTFCSKKHKDMFYERINEAVQQHCPTVKSKSMDEKFRKLQRKWIRENKDRAKEQLLTLTLP